MVIGASAGGVDPLMRIAQALRSDLRAAVFVVVHTGASSSGLLPDLIDRAGNLTAARAQDGIRIKPGQIYVAPPDYHLTLEDGQVRLNHGPRENGFRPAVDPLFRSAALEYGQRVVGVVLSGGLNDGTHGLLAIKRAGGIAIAQEPSEALNPSMPLSAVRHADPDYVLPAEDIGPLINRLEGERAPPPAERATRVVRRGPRAAKQPNPPRAVETGGPGTVPPGDATTLTCPECGGALWEQNNGSLKRFECRVGHAFTDLSLSAAQSGRLETALWTAVRVLEESSAYLRRLADRARRGRLNAIAERYDKRALDAEQRAAVILDVLARPMPELDPAEAAPATPPVAVGRKLVAPADTGRAANDRDRSPEKRKARAADSEGEKARQRKR